MFDTDRTYPQQMSNGLCNTTHMQNYIKDNNGSLLILFIIMIPFDNDYFGQWCVDLCHRIAFLTIFKYCGDVSQKALM